MDAKSAGHRLSFDEFKLYYESTEKVTDRRLETNRWNYSICIATLVAIAVLAILFCALWVGQIRDFKKLNNAKFMVLNDMAPNLEFDIKNPGAVVSYRPFEREWDKLSELSALDEVGKSNIIALKSSNIEYFIPKAFGFLFGGILIVLVIILVLNWPPTKLVHSASQLASPAPAQEEWS